MFTGKITNRGFTIVELLIVIVIIGILAAITIVAYRGINDRAILTSMKFDLSEASKSMELSKVSSDDNYPANLPSSVKPSNGNVLQLTTVGDPNSDYCINAYGTGNKVASIRTGGIIQDYLCSGPTIGTPAGGSVPTAPRGTNLLGAGFSNWTTSGNISYNSSTGEMVCSGTGSGTATSPLMRVDSPTSGTFRYEAYASSPSSTRPTSGSYVGSSYFAANGTSPAYNASSPTAYTGNGHAPVLPSLSNWHTVSWTMTLGPNVIYVHLRVSCDGSSNGYTSNTRYRNPTYTVQ